MPVATWAADPPFPYHRRGMRALVVLPTYNEIENVEEVLTRIRGSLPEADILVLDDNSPDGTASRAEEVGARLGRVTVERRPGKAGLGSAYRAGFRYGLEAGYDAMIEMDCDLSHDPAALPALVAPLGLGVELVIGSRYVPGGRIPSWPLPRRLLSRGGNLYAQVVLGIDVRDMTSGFRAYAASLLGRLDLDQIRADGYGFQVEMTLRAVEAGAEVAEVPITFVDRTRGASKMSSHIVAEALLLVTAWGVRRRTAQVSRWVAAAAGRARPAA